MEVAKAWLDYLQQWATYASACVGHPVHTPSCRPFWTLAMLAIFGIGTLLVLAIAWRVVSYRRKLAAAHQAEQERARVDHDAIAASRWDGDKAYSAELGTDEVERRVREAVAQRHAANKPDSPIIVDRK